ncbi:hypothetical protein [uncultured Microbacterium sp.]|jgi:antitoxin FitA|uniref:FitA-like ribbon-helix-helix domain-containing protein n=1 Tax=uncultured Microbacterium sp. TaxID=191216 RepID=UPI0025FCD787|nr:hypothetical protein [uncultured Microbacterium sp.]
MAAITIRNLPDETHRALRALALEHGRSTEAEVRQILNAAVADSRRVGLGSRVARIARGVDGFDLELTRDGTASAPIDLS